MTACVLSDNLDPHEEKKNSIVTTKVLQIVTMPNETKLDANIKDQYLAGKFDHLVMLKKHGRLHMDYLKTELYKQQDVYWLNMAQIGKLAKEQGQFLVEDYGLLFVKVQQAAEGASYV